MTDLENIRNFAIIAHIDHGKSTLADRLIQPRGGLAAREMKEQVLDSMEIERERGITIKAQTVRLSYTAKDGEQYQLNLMDTPGHVDFAYEVSRSLAACEGSLLVVDASQGVEAQTLANVYQAIDANHEIVPVLNKIDLPAAEPERVKQQIEDVIGLDAADAVMISAKTGLGIDDVLEAMVQRLPPPKGDADGAAEGAAGRQLVRPLSRRRDPGAHGRRRCSRRQEDPDDGDRRRAPGRAGRRVHAEGGAGRRTGARRDRLHHRRHQDRRRLQGRRHDHRGPPPGRKPLPGFKPCVPVVFCGLFPVDAADFEKLRDSLAKLRLNDASFHYEPETSAALGFGFRCGFLGLLHLEIIQERLEREFDLDLITTAPSVVYRIHLTDGAVMELHNPADMPDPVKHRPDRGAVDQGDDLGARRLSRPVLELCNERRGEQVDLTYVGNRAMAVYRLPLNEVVFDFYDRLKSISRGYASFDYQMDGYGEGDLVKLSILVNAEPVDALSMIVHRARPSAAAARSASG